MSNQNIVSCGNTTNQFIADESESHSALNKTGKVQNATKREIVDAMAEFVEKHRYQTRTREIMQDAVQLDGDGAPILDGDGEAIIAPTGTGEFEEYEVDAFEESVQEEMSKRLTNSRAGSGSALKKQNEDLQAQLEEMRAQLAKLGG